MSAQRKEVLVFASIPKSVKVLLLPWAVIFLILQLANTQDGGPNAVSRFLTMRAMGEQFTFSIDQRIGATSDWSVTPDGRHYSNKAPGPMLLGFPIFFLVDQIPRLWEKGYRDEFGLRHVPGYFTKTYTSILTQALPLLILLAFALRWLALKGVSTRSQIFFVLAVLFGTTASLYYNNYSGHGFEAIMQLATLFFLVSGNFLLAGFFGGASMLSDYGFAMQIPGFLLAIAFILQARIDKKKCLGQFALGALIPAVLWIWYHSACFGGPFELPGKYQNPIFLDTAHEEKNIWGVFHMPSLEIFLELLYGPSRGLLPTQPWVLLAFPLAILPFLKRGAAAAKTSVTNAERKSAAAFCVLGLLGLMVMNSAFGQWQGGNSAGPRYLAGVLPCFALWIALELDRLPLWARRSFEALLAVSLIFRAFVYGSTILAPGYGLWGWYYGEYATHHWTPQSRCAIFVVLIGLGFWWQNKRLRKASLAA